MLFAALLCQFATLSADDAPVPRPSAPSVVVPKARELPSIPAPALGEMRERLMESARNTSVVSLEWDKKPVSVGVHMKVIRAMHFDTEEDWKIRNLTWDCLSTPVEKIANVLNHPEDALRAGTLSQVVVFASIQTMQRITFTKTWLLSTERARFIVARSKEAADPTLLAVTILMKQQQRVEVRFVTLTLDKDTELGDSAARAIVKELDDELSASNRR